MRTSLARFCFLSATFLFAISQGSPLLRSGADEHPRGGDAVARPAGAEQDADRKTAKTDDEPSIEEKTKIHRLSSNKRSPFDAFVYLNRIPEKVEEGETADDLAGRIFGRLANQEGRVLLKLPPAMSRDAYLGFKTFMRYEGASRVGNCASCHTPVEFTDLKSHVVRKGGEPRPTPSLRNLKMRKLNLQKVIQDKLAASRRKRAGEAEEIDKAYAKIRVSEQDARQLTAFLKTLEDVSDKQFRQLILNAKRLDTSEDIEEAQP